MWFLKNDFFFNFSFAHMNFNHESARFSKNCANFSSNIVFPGADEENFSSLFVVTVLFHFFLDPHTNACTHTNAHT